MVRILLTIILSLRSHFFNCNFFIKRLSFFLIFFVFAGYQLIGQSVIEMADPTDAEIVLLEVDNKENADIIVFKTRKKYESKQWDCMWRYRKWGFSDLSIFIFSDLSDTLKYKDEDTQYKINGKVYFTENIKERGYNDPNFRIEGIIRKFKAVTK